MSTGFGSRLNPYEMSTARLRLVTMSLSSPFRLDKLRGSEMCSGLGSFRSLPFTPKKKRAAGVTRKLNRRVTSKYYGGMLDLSNTSTPDLKNLYAIISAEITRRTNTQPLTPEQKLERRRELDRDRQRRFRQRMKETAK